MNEINEYNSESIKVLSDIDHIKRRRGMYIGESDNPRALISEMIDNALDEVQAGFSDRLVVSINTENNEYAIRDYGRGIPHGKKVLDSGEELETLEVICTKSNSGGKFDNSSYTHSAGLNGLGVTVTNALSSKFEIKSYRDGKYVKFIANNGEKVNLEYGSSNEKNGTEVKFIPNPEMFRTPIIPVEYIKTRCKIASSFGFKSELCIDGEKIDTDSTIFDLITEDSEENISEYARLPVIHVKSDNDEEMEVAIKYTSATNDRYFGYTNLLHNSLGGTHTSELSKTVIQSWLEFIEKHKKIKPDTDLRNSDYLLGMRAVCAVFIMNPEFSSQTKEKLVVNKKYFDDLMDKFKSKFIEILEDNIVLAQQLLKRFEEYRVSQNKLLARKEISSIIKVNTDSADSIRRRSVVSKLVECTSKKRDDTELFLVEGNSACFTGDTEVKLLDGSIHKIEDLVNEDELWVYSSEGVDFVPARAIHPRMTRYTNELVEIELSDGSKVKCTPDHKFFDRDREEWVEAKDLYIGQSLLSIKTRISNLGYEQYYNNSTMKWRYTHKTVGEKVLGDKKKDATKINSYPVIHHSSFNKLNNDPRFLEWIDKYDHIRLHSKLGSERLVRYNKSEKHLLDMEKAWSNPDCRKRMSAPVERSKQLEINKKISEAHKDGKYINATFGTNGYNSSEKHRKDLSERYLRFPELLEKRRETNASVNKSEDHKLKLNRIRIVKVIKKCLDSNIEINRENYSKAKSKFKEKGIPTYESIINYFDSYESAIEFSRNYNLSVVGVRRINLDKEVPVYCMTVENTSNFMLANGLIVHNCGPYLESRDKELQAVLPLRGKILNVTFKNVKDAIKNNEICDIANSIGCGIGSQCDASRSRYERVIISADADPDGLQINCLVLSVFINMFPDMVRQGRVFISMPPLYCWGDSEKNYGWTNDVNKIPKNVKNVHRFKGLGEMNSDQLKFFLVDKNTRNLIQVEYPSDIDKFNKILGTSAGKSELMKELGIIYTGD